MFCDLVSAFYRVVRTLVAKGGPAEEAIPWVLRQLELPDCEIREITCNIFELSALEQADVPAHLSSIIAETMAGAHFFITGLCTCVYTNSGAHCPHFILSY